MQHFPKRIAATFFALTLIGCSQHVPATRYPLGPVTLENHQARRFDLRPGQICLITPTVQADGTLDLDVSIETTDGGGIVRRITKPHIIARSGHTLTVTAGEIEIDLIPELGKR